MKYTLPRCLVSLALKPERCSSPARILTRQRPQVALAPHAEDRGLPARRATSKIDSPSAHSRRRSPKCLKVTEGTIPILVGVVAEGHQVPVGIAEVEREGGL